MSELIEGSSSESQQQYEAPKSGTYDKQAEAILAEQAAPPEPPIQVSGMVCSREIGQLVGALATAQLKFETVKREMANPYYNSKYADLSLIMAGTQKALAENGLVVLQLPEVDVSNKKFTLTSRLAHKSGQWVENKLVLPAEMRGKDGNMRFDAQSCGSAMTYARRYAYQSLIGVAAEPDDDGNAASGLSGSKEAAQAIAQRKIAEYNDKKASASKNEMVPSLFYQHHEESNTYEITGSRELVKANWDLLKKFYIATSKTMALTGEQLEDLKYLMEQRHVEFRPLKAAS